jgi:hypothetical protein
LPDQAFEVHLGLEANEPVPGKDLGVHLIVTDAESRPLAALSTWLDPSNPLRQVEEFDRTSLVCELDELPVRAGRYLLSLRLFRSGELIDEVRDVAFEIGATDFFGTEFVPPESFPPLLVSHRWRLGEPAPTPSVQSASQR